MKTLVLFSFCVLAARAEKGILADQCYDDVCRAADGCRCSSSDNPLGSDQFSPQLVSLTFDESLTEDLYNTFWEPLLFGRTNPDGAKIGATFFVPHEYTDYSKVNSLYNYGFEIGVHSISSNNFQAYWREATEEVLDQEFGGQKTILSKFANIPAADIIGVRTPQLQIAGNNSIAAYVDSGFKYDSSWPTSPLRHLYPYTLDYRSTQQCLLGPKCPNEAFKGFWILPINDINGVDNEECNNLASCAVSGSADQIAAWLTGEVNKVRRGTRAPLTFLIHSLFFNITDNTYEGFSRFLDTVARYDDVFLVSQKQVLDWTKNPVALAHFNTDVPQRSSSCISYRCALVREVDNQLRYMNSCTSCPAVYPWLGNPEGIKR